jgi:hypothetical protein
LHKGQYEQEKWNKLSEPQAIFGLNFCILSLEAESLVPPASLSKHEEIPQNVPYYILKNTAYFRVDEMPRKPK